MFASIASLAFAAAPVEKIRNERVIAHEQTLRAGETETAGEGLPSVTVFLSDGSLELVSNGTSARAATRAVKRGDVIYRGPQDGKIVNAGGADLRFVRVELVGKETNIKWGTSGFAPDYKLLVENGYVRVYDIRIAAGHSEPQHTHHDRVVVCLSGAQLRHVFPDKRQEDSSINTDDCLWRKGSTHVGNNIGASDLWVIAIEPK